MQAAFNNPVQDAQQAFRQLLKIMSEPGVIVSLPPVATDLPLAQGTLSTLLALVDQDTPLWLDQPVPEVNTYLQFHCGAPLSETPEQASFAVITQQAQCPHLTDFQLGTEEYPDRSCTLIIETTFNDTVYRLSGPGIEGNRLITLSLPVTILEQRQALGVLFPRGLDMILIDGEQALALPRTTIVEAV